MQEPARNGTGRSERVLALYQDDAGLAYSAQYLMTVSIMPWGVV